jgi:hypothetical protein
MPNAGFGCSVDAVFHYTPLATAPDPSQSYSAQMGLVMPIQSVTFMLC